MSGILQARITSTESKFHSTNHQYAQHKAYTGPGCAVCGKDLEAHHPARDWNCSEAERETRLSNGWEPLWMRYNKLCEPVPGLIRYGWRRPVTEALQ